MFPRTMDTFIGIFYVKLPLDTEHNTRFKDRKISVICIYIIFGRGFLIRFIRLKMYSVFNILGSSHLKKKDFVRVPFIESTT